MPSHDLSHIKSMRRINLLSDEQIDLIEDFIDKHDLDIQLGKYKTTRFLHRLWKEEEAKRKKGKKIQENSSRMRRS